jgi:diguanylate cyclase (GGDEF)-like protein
MFTILCILLSQGLTALMLYFLPGAVTQFDVHLIAFICPLLITPVISFAIIKLICELHHQEQKMRDFAQKDSLTKFLSRRAWFEFAEQYEVIAKRQKRPFTLLMLDLDNFKRINDEFGHLAGDKILKQFAVITRSVARDSDIIGRFGGEEFIFLLPNTGAEQAYSLCERLHNEIRNTVIEYKGQKLTFTTSIGIACQTESHEHNLDHLISLADNALYTAKSRGKNCSFLYRETYLTTEASYA